MATVQAQANGVDSVDEAVLFAFDNELIPHTRNLELRMEKARKHEANPVVGRGEAGEPDAFGVQFYGSIVHDQGTYRMWYVAIDEDLNSPDPAVRTRSLRPAYAESDDGLHWTKPELGLVDYRGSTANNLVAIEPATIGTINLKVLIDPDDPDPERRHKMVAQTWWWEKGERGRGTLCPLVSADGYRWRILADMTPVKGCIPKEEILIPPRHFEAAGGLYRWQGLYYAAGQSGSPEHYGGRLNSGREIVIHRSRDFAHWSDTASLGFVREGQYLPFRGGEGEEAHEGVSVWNRGNVLLGLYGIWHGGVDWPDRTIDLGLLMSHDGVRFCEPVTEHVFLERGADGEWDQGGLIQGQGFENVGDKTFMWYGAWDPRPFEPYEPRGGVGLAVLDRDRLACLAPRTEDEDAALVTKAMSMVGTASVLANVEIPAKGASLEIELLDRYEQPISGFSGADAAVVNESGLRVPVRWPSGKAYAGAADEPVKIRVRFSGGSQNEIKLYALYVGTETK